MLMDYFKMFIITLPYLEQNHKYTNNSLAPSILELKILNNVKKLYYGFQIFQFIIAI